MPEPMPHPADAPGEIIQQSDPVPSDQPTTPGPDASNIGPVHADAPVVPSE